ncbi:MAG: glycosyltransferase, partial [Pseudomonadota bacterium]
MTNLNADALITHINLARGFRGGEAQTELLIRALTERGIRQRLVARSAEPLIVRTADLANLERLPVSGLWEAQRALRGATLVHAHEGRCIQAAGFAHWLRGTPFIITRREVKPYKRRWSDRIYRRAAARVGLSRAIATELAERAGIDDAHIIPSAFTPRTASQEKAGQLRRQWGGGPVIGHVGALVQAHKGQDLLLVVARRRPGWQFVFVGDGKDEAMLKAQAAGLANVWFTGRVDDVASHLAAFDVFAFPSRHEGLGSTLLDALYQQ